MDSASNLSFSSLSRFLLSRRPLRRIRSNNGSLWLFLQSLIIKIIQFYLINFYFFVWLSPLRFQGTERVNFCDFELPSKQSTFSDKEMTCVMILLELYWFLWTRDKESFIFFRFNSNKIEMAYSVLRLRKVSALGISRILQGWRASTPFYSLFVSSL